MKHVFIKRKLVLNKTTVNNLNQEEMEGAKAGGVMTGRTCGCWTDYTKTCYTRC